MCRKSCTGVQCRVRPLGLFAYARGLYRVCSAVSNSCSRTPLDFSVHTDTGWPKTLSVDFPSP